MAPRKAVLLTVVLLLLGGTARAVVWLPHAFDEPTIDRLVMRAVESDAGFSTTPLGAAQVSSGRRLECTDPSGDQPLTFRDLSVPWPDDQVLLFYRYVLVSRGWTTVSSAEEISSEGFTKTIAERTIQLDVSTGVDSDNVSIAARTPC